MDYTADQWDRIKTLIADARKSWDAIDRAKPKDPPDKIPQWMLDLKQHLEECD